MLWLLRPAGRSVVTLVAHATVVAPYDPRAIRVTLVATITIRVRALVALGHVVDAMRGHVVVALAARATRLGVASAAQTTAVVPQVLDGRTRVTHTLERGAVRHPHPVAVVTGLLVMATAALDVLVVALRLEIAAGLNREPDILRVAIGAFR